MTSSPEDLYALPLSEFTAARNALAASLKKDGDTGAADAVRTLKKPSITAWAINQVARSHRKEVEALLEAGEQLMSAQGALLAGSDPSALRDATRRRRELVTSLTNHVTEALEEAGTAASRAHLDRINSTLLNAVVDEDGRRLLASGMLTDDVGASEDLGGAWATDAAVDIDVRPAKEVRAARKEAERLAKEADDAEAFASEMAQEADAARRAADLAMQTASDARRAALQARKRANDARHSL
ncbi:MAG: hypothetical protein M3124_01985 [Actinomycetota bacterium]|nr:hypothetical protein [Actinomycetota bacterium]